MNTFSIGCFPTVIEPTLQVLEAKAGAVSAEELTQQGRWRRLVRVDLASVEAAFPRPETMLQVFGTHPAVSDCEFLLGYSQSGVRSYAAWHREGRWELAELPSEARGEAVYYPSVRLTFKTMRSQQAFLRYVQLVLADDIFNPAMRAALANLVCPPVSIDVAVATEGK